MDYIEKIRTEVNIALKSGGPDKLRLNTLRLLLSELKNQKINQGKDLTDEEAMQVIKREVKKRRQAIEEYEKIGRHELSDKEKDELKILEEFLPPELSEEEIETKVSGIIAGLGDVSENDFGRVMGLSMKELKGQADGQLINKVVKRLLERK